MSPGPTLVTDVSGKLENPEICPFMSGRLVPVQTGIQSAGQMTVQPIMVPCQHDGCAMFDGEECSLYSQPMVVGTMESIVIELQRLTEVVRPVDDGLTVIAGKLNHLEPPKSESPLARIATALEEIVNQNRKKDE